MQPHDIAYLSVDTVDSEQPNAFAEGLAGQLSRRAAVRWGGVALAAALAVGGAGSGPATAQASSVASDPAAVVRAYIAAVNAHDLAAIVDVFAPNAMYIVMPPPPSQPTGIYTGRTQISTFYEAAVVNHDHLEVVPGTLQVKGNSVTYVKRIASGPWLKLGLGTIDANIYAIVAGNQFAAYIAMLTPHDVARLFAATGVLPHGMQVA